MKRNNRRSSLFSFLRYPLPKSNDKSAVRFYNGRRVYVTTPPAKSR